jgi:hypothetical protein
VNSLKLLNNKGSFLVDKFGSDKRLPHLSSLIVSGQISRNEALEELEKEQYDPSLLRQDREFVLKKFGMGEDDYEKLLSIPLHSHLDYPNLHMLYMRSNRLLKYFKRFAKVI